MTELDRLRNEIDGLDAQIVQLLEERMDLSRRIGAYKLSNSLPVLDEGRENTVVQSRVGMLQNKDNQEAVAEIYRLIMRYSRANQRDGL